LKPHTTLGHPIAKWWTVKEAAHSLYTAVRRKKNKEIATSEVFTPRQGKQRNSDSLANILKEETGFLMSPEHKMYEKAMLICEYQGLNSPRMNHHLYDMARAIVVETLEDLGTEDPNEGSNGFYGMLKKQLLSLIDMQLTHQIASLSPLKPRIHDPEHQPVLINEMTMSRSGADIVIPSKAKPPLTMGASQVDPNVEGAFAGLDTPQQPGESTQAYEQ